MDPANLSPKDHFRALSRQSVNLAGALRGRGQDEDLHLDVRVVDLGLGGACVESSNVLPRGTAIELIVETPHLWEPLKLIGAVAWSRALADPEAGGAMLGVRFEHASGGTARTLAELLEAEAFG